MAITLYGFGESGNAYKVALMLGLTGLPYRLEFVPFFAGGTRTPEFLALNEMGEVPVLVDDDLTLAQSGVILDHLARKTGHFAGQGEAIQREVLRWTLWDNHKFSSQIGTLRFLKNFVPEDKRPQPVIDWLQGRVRVAFKVLDGHLKSRAFVAGDDPTTADLSLCSYLYYPESFGFDPAEWPAIAGWLARIAALPGWAHPYDLMPRAFPPSPRMP